MPIVHINLLEGRSQTYLKALGDAIHQALMETWGIPESDRFHLFHEKKAEHFKIDRFCYLEGDVQRSDDVVLIQIITSPRTIDMKHAFYRRLPKILQEKISLGPENVFINVVMTDEEDWSVGMGKMTLIERLK